MRLAGRGTRYGPGVGGSRGRGYIYPAPGCVAGSGHLAISTVAARGVALSNRRRRAVPAFPVGSRVIVRIIPKRRSVLLFSLGC